MENRIKLFALFIRDVWRRVNGKKEGKLKATKGGGGRGGEKESKERNSKEIRFSRVGHDIGNS